MTFALSPPHVRVEGGGGMGRGNENTHDPPTPVTFALSAVEGGGGTREHVLEYTHEHSKFPPVTFALSTFY